MVELIRYGKLYVKLFRTRFNTYCTHQSNASACIHFHPTCSQSYCDIIKRDLSLHLEFITEDDEKSLLDEVESVIGRKRYEFDHWDDAIHGYRELDRSTWKPCNERIFKKIRATAFASKNNLIEPVHILDLAETGWIKPHVDSVKFCGNIIAGLSLLTDSVMRFVLEGNKSVTFDILLKRRSLYIMRDEIRYKFLHEILKNEESFFNGARVDKGRRVSLICRNQKNDNDAVI